MASPAENILQNLFETSALENVSSEQIRQIADEYPFFSAAHFLLAKKLFLSNDTGQETVLQKAALHFSNDLWFHFSLHENGEDVVAENDFAINEEGDLVEEYTEPNDAVSEKLSNILQQQAAEFDKPVETSTEIPVENIPYHRVDYFDSQGIKLDEGKANDKLGAQLKRFTDWLKQMKRINANPGDLGSDEAGESQVKNIAEHSNDPEEIVTETMAEVLLKQGKPEQAIQIYEKLSFNNPSKSAYFEAKIQELKDQ